MHVLNVAMVASARYASLLTWQLRPLRWEGTLAARVEKVDNPAFLREGPVESPGGQLKFPRDVLSFWKHEVDIPPKVN